MPEGDTVFKLARYLGPELIGRRVVDGFARGVAPSDLSGRTVARVHAHGKHLFIAFDDETLLRSHLGMWGTWHGYARGERWQKPRRQAAIVIDTGERVFVCFNPLQVELLRDHGVRRRRLGNELGPDLLRPGVDYGLVIARARQLVAVDAPLVDVLLHQRVATGIGNVFKSEVLFVQGCDPAMPLGACSDERLRELYVCATRLMGRNTAGGPRVTRRANDDAGRLWVYGRAGQPCLRCEDRIRSQPMGRGLRSTYWCPACQPRIAPIRQDGQIETATDG
jgi:endonuclease-8